jgi:GT2 family glycosyltransferase
MKIPKVSIIILNFNGLKDTIKCLNSIKLTRYKNYEIIFIDNGSNINEAEKVKGKYPFIRQYRIEKNLGFTGGNNWALNQTKGKYIVLLNNDTLVTSNWLNKLVDYMEDNKNVAVAQPKILQMKHPKYFDYAGAAGGYVDKYGYPFTRGRIFNTHEKDVGQYDKNIPIFWASGAACIIRKQVIKNVGGLFNEKMFNYMEEIDFCWRVWRAGLQVRFVHESVVYHKVAGTAGRNVIQKRYWEHRNNLYLLINNLDRSNVVKILPVRIVLELITYVYYLISKQGPFTKSLFRAHKDIISTGFSSRYKRKRFIKDNRAPIYPGSIVLDHYIFRKKSFKSLDWSPLGNIAYLLYNNKQNTGSEVVFKQANKFIEKGYCVKIYSIFGNGQNWYQNNVVFKNIIYSLFDRKFDIVISTFWPTSYFSFVIPAKQKYYFSQDWGPSMHDFLLFKIFAKYSYKLIRNHIVISEFLKKNIQIANRSANISKINYCVLTKDFTNNFKKRRSILGPKKTINILTVVSWYSTAKGPDQLARVVLYLKKSHNNYKFTLISREPKPYSKVFDKFISNPTKSKIADAYRNADVVISTSRSEGFLIIGLEAMASGCLFLTTKNGGVNEYAVNNHNAILVENYKDIYKKDLIENTLKDKELYNTLITNGRKTASMYRDTKIIDELEHILFLNDKKII